MLRCGGGDRAAYETLLRRYETRLVAYIRSIVRDRDHAEDLFQETFLRVHNAAPRYVPHARLSTYLYTIARNLCLNFLQKKREIPVELEEDRAGAVQADEAGRSVDLADLKRHLDGALGRLPAKEREAVTLRYVNGLPYKRIAEIMGAPMGTVASWVHDGLKRLSPGLEKFSGLAEGGDR